MSKEGNLVQNSIKCKVSIGIIERQKEKLGRTTTKAYGMSLASNYGATTRPRNGGSRRRLEKCKEALNV